MRVYCRCGNILRNQMDPNDTEYYVYSDLEWCSFLTKETINIIDTPYPNYNVWHCEKCGRITVFDDSYNLLSVYKPEEWFFNGINGTWKLNTHIIFIRII